MESIAIFHHEQLSMEFDLSSHHGKALQLFFL